VILLDFSWEELHRQNYHFFGIFGNLEMSGNLAKDGENSRKSPKSGKGQGICLVGKI